MLAFAGFAIGYFMRPIGGVVLGPLCDRVGRRRMLVGSVLAVALVTLAMGSRRGTPAWDLPGHSSYGEYPLCPSNGPNAPKIEDP